MQRNEVYIMENFKVIYKILKIIEKSMDLEEFDKKSISRERFELTEPRYNRIMTLLVKEGYITGVEIWNSRDCEYPRICITRPEITIKGLEYMEDNTFMKRAADIAKGIKDTIPGM